MKISAQSRNTQGSSASRRLRRTGVTPGIIYGGDSAPQNISLDHNTLFHLLLKEQFHSSILELEIDNTLHPVVLRDYQMHPYKKLVLHIDFQRVLAHEELTVSVPLHFVKAEDSLAIKRDKCLISHLMNQIQISCLPSKLPEFIEVDLSKLERGTSLHVSDLVLPEGVKAVRHGADENPAIVTVIEPKAEKETEVTPAAAPSNEADKTKDGK